jgi:hypothetical protein
MLAGGAVELAKEFGGLRFPCWTGHLSTFREIFKSVPEIMLVPVRDEHEMFALQRLMILTGIYKYPYEHWRHSIDLDQWRDGPPTDVHFYEQIGVPIDKKWESFPWRYEGPGPKYDDKPYIFVHDDAARGYIMDLDRIGRNWTQDMMVCPDRDFLRPITAYADQLMGAHEIHCINSCFPWFCEFLPLPVNQRRFLHRYARPYRNCDIYDWRHHWIVLD